ncbi:hypothetical protein FA13DRAFT_1139966 [Coprinellus micaceus]|uniref:Uncharacterized protein n=1 Tax=Coprinellus micaceus TaxID=71717 RepID=A0A4Y7SV51_COPMI|nr:hypothetical protein FA13DRAFT_1139966 [Coprinellus micaceus]
MWVWMVVTQTEGGSCAEREAEVVQAPPSIKIPAPSGGRTLTQSPPPQAARFDRLPASSHHPADPLPGAEPAQTDPTFPIPPHSDPWNPEMVIKPPFNWSSAYAPPRYDGERDPPGSLPTRRRRNAARSRTLMISLAPTSPPISSSAKDPAEESSPPRPDTSALADVRIQCPRIQNPNAAPVPTSPCGPSERTHRPLNASTRTAPRRRYTGLTHGEAGPSGEGRDGEAGEAGDASPHPGIMDCPRGVKARTDLSRVKTLSALLSTAFPPSLPPPYLSPPCSPIPFPLPQRPTVSAKQPHPGDVADALDRRGEGAYSNREEGWACLLFMQSQVLTAGDEGGARPVWSDLISRSSLGN